MQVPLRILRFSRRQSMEREFRQLENSWRSSNEWRSRYSKLYSSQRFSIQKQDEPRRISFMGNDISPYASLLSKMRSSNATSPSELSSPQILNTILSERDDSNNTQRRSIPSKQGGAMDTLLLDMVRSRSAEVQNEARDKASSLPHEDESEEESNDVCVHGYNYRMTERSISRSRVSRMSTRRDMDIPSILAFPTNITAPVQLEIPAFQKVPVAEKEKIPKWSIRRSLCPVCSQKWKDRSSIINVKSSGLKRNSSLDLPSVIAPARLRKIVTCGYSPRPVPVAIDKEAGIFRGRLRQTSTSWQLTRARRFRIPKPLMPPPEATAPPSCAAPLARKDLDLRVLRFLKDEFQRTST